ncbi:MAG: pilus assembly protein PilP [Betaproteobacteria bacterium]|nr:pilus assembly protein PilP [Betaproteobacteria bacterium]
MILRRAGPALLLAALLAGCADDQAELTAWMAEKREQTARLKQKLDPPKKPLPFRYEANDLVEPFSMARIAVAAEPIATRSGSGPRPDQNRRREALESFPLDTIRLVGHLTSGGQQFALLQVGKTVHQVKVGNYVGTNFGRVVKITETEVQIRELVQDSSGDWSERDNSLRLQGVR